MIEIVISASLGRELGLPPFGRFAVFCVETDFQSKPEAFSYRSNLSKAEAVMMADEVSEIDGACVRIGMVCDHHGVIVPRDTLGEFATVRVANF